MKKYIATFYVKRFNRVEKYYCILKAENRDKADLRLSELWNFNNKFRALATANGRQCHLFSVKIARYKLTPTDYLLFFIPFIKILLNIFTNIFIY